MGQVSQRSQTKTRREGKRQGQGSGGRTKAYRNPEGRIGAGKETTGQDPRDRAWP